jgi:hypothetical protein
MQLIFDHLTALTVSAILIGVIATINMRGQASSVEATQFHAAKTQQNVLIEMLEYDLEDLGSGVPRGEQMITDYQSDSFGIKVFEFRRELADATGAPHLATVRYERAYVGSYTAGDVTLPRFRIRRLVQAVDSSMVSTTGSGFDVVALEIDLLGTDGEGASENLNAASSIKVRLKSALPFQTGDEMRFSSWDGVFRPSNLARRSDAAGGVGADSSPS